MPSLNSLSINNLLAKGDVRQVGTDSPIAIRLKYFGTGGVTSVITTTATDIEFITTGTGAGTDTYLFSDYATVGALVDAINSRQSTENIALGDSALAPNFKAKVLDTVRSEATATQFVAETITAADEDGVSYYDVNVDTSAAKYFAVRLTFDRGFEKSKIQASHRVELQEIKYFATLGNVSANDVKIYEINGTDETIKYQDLSVSATATTINFAGGEGVITAGDGNDIVIKIEDDTTLADAAANYLRITGLLK